MSTVGHSDFSHGIPGDFASRLIRPGTQPRRAAPYEISRGYACSFPAVPPAHTLLCPGAPSISFASIVQARFPLDLADRFALFGYGPAFRLKPFGPHLTVGALSCAVVPENRAHLLLLPPGLKRPARRYPRLWLRTPLGTVRLDSNQLVVCL